MLLLLQERLSELAILSIENVAARKLAVNTIIDDFARRKVRLRLLSGHLYIVLCARDMYFMYEINGNNNTSLVSNSSNRYECIP